MEKIIQNYQFGKITIGDKIYTDDDLLISSGIVAPWRCSDHHHPSLDDFADVLRNEVKILIIGTGYYGVMEIESGLLNELKKKINQVIIENTKKANKIYNKLSRNKEDVIACLHLTC